MTIELETFTPGVLVVSGGVQWVRGKRGGGHGVPSLQNLGLSPFLLSSGLPGVRLKFFLQGFLMIFYFPLTRMF